MKKLLIFPALFQLGLLANLVSCAHRHEKEDEQNEVVMNELVLALTPPDESERPDDEMDRDPRMERRLVSFPIDCTLPSNGDRVVAAMVFVQPGYLKVMGCDNPSAKRGLAFVMRKDACRNFGDFAPVPIIAGQTPKIYRMPGSVMEGKPRIPQMIYVFNAFGSDPNTTHTQVDYRCVPRSELSALFDSLPGGGAGDMPNLH